VNVLAIVEDEPDLRVLIRLTIKRDSRFEVVGEAASAAGAIALLESTTDEIGLIVLDHSIEGDVMGIQAAPLLKALAPAAKIILFTAYQHLQHEAEAEPAIDAFLLKTDISKLLPLAQHLVGFDAAT
jgi:DNA-binding NarL/FixJ family response regulator